MQNVYKLREACTFFPYDGHAHEAAFIVRTPENRQFKISRIAREILLQLDGRATLDTIAATLNSRSIAVSAEELLSLMKSKYHPLGIVESIDEPSAQTVPGSEQKIRLPFLLHWDLLPARYVRALSSRLTFLFSQSFVLLALCSIIATHYIVYFNYSSPEFLSGADFLQVLALCLLSVLWHELGHSSAVSRYGGSPGKIGFGLFVLLPSFYADVSEVWRFPRRQRMVVDLGGVYFQLVFFAAIATLGVLTGDPELFVACRFIDLMVLLTLNPVIQFDGYWFLADWLAFPNLYRTATSYLKRSVKRLFGPEERSAALPALPRRVQLVLVIYAVLSNLFLLGMIWISYRYLLSTFTRVPSILPAIFNSMLFAFKAHDMIWFANRFLTLFFVLAFPATALVGLFRYFVILVRYCGSKVQVAGSARMFSARKHSTSEGSQQ